MSLRLSLGVLVLSGGSPSFRVVARSAAPASTLPQSVALSQASQRCGTGHRHLPPAVICARKGFAGSAAKGAVAVATPMGHCPGAQMPDAAGAAQHVTSSPLGSPHGSLHCEEFGVITQGIRCHARGPLLLLGLRCSYSSHSSQ